MDTQQITLTSIRKWKQITLTSIRKKIRGVKKWGVVHYLPFKFLYVEEEVNPNYNKLCLKTKLDQHVSQEKDIIPWGKKESILKVQ